MRSKKQDNSARLILAQCTIELGQEPLGVDKRGKQTEKTHGRRKFYKGKKNQTYVKRREAEQTNKKKESNETTI